MPLPVLDDPARARWRDRFDALLAAGGHRSQAQLAADLSESVGLKVTTLKAEVSRLRDGDPALVERWLEDGRRTEALADALGCAPHDLRSGFAHAARPDIDDPWAACFRGDPPPWIEARLRRPGFGGESTDATPAGWVEQVVAADSAWRAVVIVGLPGSGRHVAREQLITAFPVARTVPVTVSAECGPREQGVLVLEVVPWGAPELDRLRELLGQHGGSDRSVAALTRLRALLVAAPRAWASLSRPAVILPHIAEGSERNPVSALAERACACAARRSGSAVLRALGVPFLSALFARWAADFEPYRPWRRLRRAEVERHVQAALVDVGSPPLTSEEVERYARELSAKEPEALAQTTAALKRRLCADPGPVLEALVVGGLLGEHAKEIQPTDPRVAAAFAALGLLTRSDLGTALHPHHADILELLAGAGLEVRGFLARVEASSPARRVAAVQAGVMFLAAAPAPGIDTPTAVRVWASALWATLHATGRYRRPGYIQVAPLDEDLRLFAAFDALSEQGRAWLPELASEPMAALAALVPTEILMLAVRWDEGLPDWEPDEQRTNLRFLAPWQHDPLAATSSSVILAEQAAAMLTWRAERGEARAQRILAGLEAVPENLGAVGLAVWRQVHEHGLRWLAVASGTEAELEGAFWARPRWPWCPGEPDSEDTAALLRRLPGERVRAWLRHTLLHDELRDPLSGLHLHEPPVELLGLTEETRPPTQLRNPERRAPLLDLAARLGDHALLAELAGLPDVLIADPSRWRLLMRWHAPSSANELRLEGLLPGILAVLGPLQRLDGLAEAAAETLAKLGHPDALRERWRRALAIPDGLAVAAASRALLAHAAEAGEGAWSVHPPPSEAPTSEGLVLYGGFVGQERRHQSWGIAHRSRDDQALPDSARPAVGALCAASESCEFSPHEPLSPAVLDWLARLALARTIPVIDALEPATSVESSRSLRRVAWGCWDVSRDPSSCLQEPKWPADRAGRALAALLARADEAVIRAALDGERPTRWRVAEHWRKGGAFAERAWALASGPARVDLVRDILEQGAPDAPRRWAARAATLDVERLAPSLLGRLSGDAALALGEPWVARSTGRKALDRAMSLHERAPWPAVLVESLRGWLRDEPEPFGAEPGADARETTARVLRLLQPAAEGRAEQVPLPMDELRAGVARLWDLGLAQPPDPTPSDDGWWPPGKCLAALLDELAGLLGALDHGRLVALWRRLHASPAVDRPRPDVPGERWAWLTPRVLAWISVPELHKLLGGPFSGGAARELLRRGDAATLDQAMQSLRAERAWSLGLDAPVDARLGIPWYEALDALCRGRPAALEDLVETWLEAEPERRMELLRVLAGWTEPPDPVSGAAVLLERELGRLLGG